MAGGNGIIGIIGGVGPLATWDFAQRITALTHAHLDQEHLRVLVDSNTNIADRTQAILHGGPSPLPDMIKSAQLLEKAGATVLAMPCNTGHYYHSEVADAVTIPFLNMIDEVALELKEQGIVKAAIFATDGTRQADIYGTVFARHGIQHVYPHSAHQALVMDIVYKHVKAGNLDFSDIPIWDIIEDVRDQGAEYYVLGCTELPIAFEAMGITSNTISSTDALARAAIRAAGGTVRAASQ